MRSLSKKLNYFDKKINKLLKYVNKMSDLKNKQDFLKRLNAVQMKRDRFIMLTTNAKLNKALSEINVIVAENELNLRLKELQEIRRKNKKDNSQNTTTSSRRLKKKNISSVKNISSNNIRKQLNKKPLNTEKNNKKPKLQILDKNISPITSYKEFKNGIYFTSNLIDSKSSINKIDPNKEKVLRQIFAKKNSRNATQKIQNGVQITVTNNGINCFKSIDKNNELNKTNKFETDKMHVETIDIYNDITIKIEPEFDDSQSITSDLHKVVPNKVTTSENTQENIKSKRITQENILKSQKNCRKNSFKENVNVHNMCRSDIACNSRSHKDVFNFSNAYTQIMSTKYVKPVQ